MYASAWKAENQCRPESYAEETVADNCDEAHGKVIRGFLLCLTPLYQRFRYLNASNKVARLCLAAKTRPHG